ncbi:MAG: PqqD family protein [Anaerolineales bacterium]|nr:PqqD family protein [Anaerolineales bacterium]
MDENTCFVVHDNVAIEEFPDGSLALLCDQLYLISLNTTAKDILEQLDGSQPVFKVAEILANKYGCPYKKVLVDTKKLITELEEKGIVKRCVNVKGPR